MDIMALCDLVRQTAYDIHAYHGPGHLEKPYENALAHRLRKAGLSVEQQYPITIYDEDGTIIGNYIADLLIEGELIIEVKALKTLASEHIAQVMGYLKSARKVHGLLINFGAHHFQIRKFAWDPNFKKGSISGGGIVSSLLFSVSCFLTMLAR